jgi:hypothetical protein
LILLAVEGAAWFLFFRNRVRNLTSGEPIHTAAQQQAIDHARSNDPRSSYDMGEADEELSEEICQQLIRSHSETTEDRMIGFLRARFDAGTRSQSIHVAFCPPMLHRPDVRFFQLSGARVRISAADVQTVGIRFDLRLVSPSQVEEQVVLHFEATCGKPESAGVGVNQP